MSINNDISRAVLLRTHGQHTEALAILLDLEKIAPDDAALHFEIACTYDTHRLEADAIPHYEKALAVGLVGEKRRDALLGLGSSYRCMEQYADAVRTLERGMAEFPQAHEYAVFLAMALHNLGDHRRALQLLLKHVAEHTSDPQTAKYQRALFHYAENLDPPYDET